MKNLLLSILAIWISIPTQAAILIQDAIKENLVTVKLRTNENSTHYSSPFVLQVENRTKDPLDISLENGVVFIAEDASEQDFIVTQQELLSLSPNKSKEVEIHAMCIEQMKSAPELTSVYTIGELANSSLRKLSSFVQEMKRFEPDAQFLMWDIAEGFYSKEQVDDFEIDSNGVVWVVDIEEGERNVIEPTDADFEFLGPTLLVQGEFTMYFSRPQSVHIAMFNKQNVLVKELFKQDHTPKGETNLAYAFNSNEYPEEAYFVKLIVEGTVRFTRKIEMN